VIGRLARAVVVAADGERGHARLAQVGQAPRDEGALGVARIDRVEQVTTLQKEVGLERNCAVDGVAERPPQPAPALLEAADRHLGVVAVEVVVGGDDGADRHRGERCGEIRLGPEM
jgi:hypothetical protein